MIFVSHDREFVNKVVDRLIIFKNLELCEFEGNLENLKKCKTSQIKLLRKTKRKTIIRMKMAQIAAKLSKSDEDKENLEREYQQLAGILATYSEGKIKEIVYKLSCSKERNNLLEEFVGATSGRLFVADFVVAPIVSI